tara:strand:- start:163 stop:612 length:450 start_codon:yes stop_codon:yes gene_type:complete
VNRRIAHNFTWGPIFIIGIIANISGTILFMHKEPWLLNQIPNEVLLQTSFSILFSEKINIGLPLFLSTIYRFFGLWLLTVGSMIICYVYVTRLGTKIARNSIFAILLVNLIAIYYLVFSYLPSFTLLPILHFLAFCLLLSVFCSKYLPD